MAIAPDSASYPILGAALASGVSYRLALAWVEASDRWGPEPTVYSVREAIIAAHGYEAYSVFFDRIDAAYVAGRLRIARWPS